jgi:hypothetical protein
MPQAHRGRRFRRTEKRTQTRAPLVAANTRLADQKIKHLIERKGGRPGDERPPVSKHRFRVDAGSVPALGPTVNLVRDRKRKGTANVRILQNATLATGHAKTYSALAFIVRVKCAVPEVVHIPYRGAGPATAFFVSRRIAAAPVQEAEASAFPSCYALLVCDQQSYCPCSHESSGTESARGDASAQQSPRQRECPRTASTPPHKSRDVDWFRPS